MKEEQVGGEEQTTEEAWEEVARRFEALGNSLDRAIRAAWEREDTQRHLASIQGGLQKMADKIDRAISEASESAEARALRSEADKAAESARLAGEQTWREARPHLLSALTRINAELERAIARMERQEPTSEAEGSQHDPRAGGEAGGSDTGGQP
ncbi:MAG: hypothetical protein R6X31_12875 [Anaerolineae bacterium]